MTALLRKELREHLFSAKGLMMLFIVAVLNSILAFSFISVKELSLLAQVEVNMTFMRVMLGTSILVLLVIGSTLFSGEKEKGTLESLLLTPLSKLRIVTAKMTAIVCFWLVLVALSIPYIISFTGGTTMLPLVLLFVLLIGTPLVLSFAGLSLVFSAAVSSTKNALLFSIVLFLIAVIPMFLSTTTKKAGFAYTVNQISPVSASQLALRDMLVNKAGVGVIFQDAVPIIVFLLICGGLLWFVGKKIDFLGGDGR